MTEYQIPNLAPGEIHRAEETIQRSRFIVTMARVSSHEEARAFVERIRQEHAHATHNCWAYVAGEPGSTAQIGASDDGEPKGTAGRPMLTVLLHCGVGEIAAVVTRYYGGILLGTGGLVRAYQGLTKLGLERLPVKTKVPSEVLTVHLSHRMVNVALRDIERTGAQILKKTFGADARFVIEVPIERIEALIKRLEDISAGEAHVKRTSKE